MKAENEHQRALRLWITAGLSIPEVINLKGDAGYLLNNMIAKYTLSADYYLISEAALRQLQREGVDIEKIHKRSEFYGKNSLYIYEHSIPSSIIRAELLKSDRAPASVENILQQTGHVAVLLRTENANLSHAKLQRRMPSGWKIGGDPFARYKEVGIGISKAVLKVDGPIMR